MDQNERTATCGGPCNCNGFNTCNYAAFYMVAMPRDNNYNLLPVNEDRNLIKIMVYFGREDVACPSCLGFGTGAVQVF